MIGWSFSNCIRGQIRVVMSNKCYNIVKKKKRSQIFLLINRNDRLWGVNIKHICLKVQRFYSPQQFYSQQPQKMIRLEV